MLMTRMGFLKGLLCLPAVALLPKAKQDCATYVKAARYADRLKGLDVRWGGAAHYSNDYRCPT